MNSHGNQNEGIRVLEEFVCEAIPDPSALSSKSVKVEIEWPGVSLPSALDELARALPAEHRARMALAVEPARRKPGVSRWIRPLLVASSRAWP